MTARNTYAQLMRQLEILEASVARVLHKGPSVQYRIYGGLADAGGAIAFNDARHLIPRSCGGF
jgi:hypothetical protein